MNKKLRDASRRGHPLWYAFILHRISGLALTLFLPLHFWALSLAVTGPAALDEFLSWTDNPLVKLLEFVIVLMLAVHVFGGLRLLALEFLPWRANHKTLAAGALALSFLVSVTFLLQAV